MNLIDLKQFQFSKPVQFWLIATAAGLGAIHLTLSWRADNTDLIARTLLFFFVIATSLSDRRSQLRFESGWLPSVLGLLMIGLLLLRSMLRPTDTFLLIFPAIAGLALVLLSSGFSGIRQYRRELILLCFLGIPKIVVPIFFDPTGMTAEFSTLILWYLGFQVRLEGLVVYLPTGSVEVYSGCSGIDSITHMLALSGLFLIMVPTGWLMRILVPLMAGAIAFIVNGFRVALMAHLVASGQPQAFDYWHRGNGSLVFSMIAVLLFGGFCLLTMRLMEAAKAQPNGMEWQEDETEWQEDEVEWQEEL